MVRLGRHGEGEPRALDDLKLRINFGIAQDISHLKNREALIQEMAKRFPDDKPGRHKNFAAQVNQFKNVAKVGDFVVTPLKTSSTIAIGRFAGPYEVGPDGTCERPVEWLRTEIPRDAFKQDMLHSLGSIGTVCEISRNNALARFKAVIATGKDPGDGQVPKTTALPVTGDAEESSDLPLDLVQVARDQIERRMASAFAGHDFTELVAALLRAQGYQARVSPPGADQGVDIVAGSGPLGLDAPRIVVQVKSGSQTVDQPTLQALIGSIHDVQADHGLIVSWGGYTSNVRRRQNELFFRVRLWGRDDVIDAFLTHYDKLPEDIRAELPMKRIWTPVLDDDEDLS